MVDFRWLNIDISIEFSSIYCNTYLNSHIHGRLIQKHKEMPSNKG